MSEQLGAGIDIEDVREVFDLFDFWDGRDGLIGAEKVGDLLRCLGLNPTNNVVKKLGGTEKPGEKQFSFEEFLAIVKSFLKVEDTGTYTEFCEAFKSFDREGMGYITAAEMNYMLTAMGEKLTDAECDAIMTDTDTQPDYDGNMKYEDFIKKVMRGHGWKK